GAEKVREPREPEENPPPTRASAEEIADIVGSANDNTMAIALTNPRMRGVSVVMSVFPKCPRQGEPPLRLAGLAESEATIGTCRCGPPSRECAVATHSQRTCPTDLPNRFQTPLPPFAHEETLLRRHGFLHRLDQLRQGEGLWQEGELLV